MIGLIYNYIKNYMDSFYSKNLFICYSLSLFILLSFSTFQISYQLNYYPNTTNSCNCVIFRMDDVQDYWIEQGQIVPMDLFLNKNQSLTLGLLMDSIGNESKIYDKIKEGFNKGLFELALEGWNQTDY